MITVWSVFWGNKYSSDYVYRLKRMVERNLSLPHRFRCITDAKLVGIDCVKPACDYHGWWQKLSLFKPGMATGPNLYVDLDVVIVDQLNTLVTEYKDCPLAMPANWALTVENKGTCQSSVMIWSGDMSLIWDSFDYQRDSERLLGDQEYITELLGNPGNGNITKIEDGHIVSYRYHCQGAPPEHAKVVSFHGKPDPHEVFDSWVTEKRRLE